MSIKAEIGKIEESNGQAITTLVITVENISTTSVRLIGSLYTLSGSAVSSVNPSGSAMDSVKVDAVTRSNYGPGARSNAGTELTPPELIQFGQIVWDQSTLVPDESTETSVVAPFPAGRFDLLRVGVDLVLARDDRLPISELNSQGSFALTTQCAGREVHVQTWPIIPGSMVEELTATRREVVLGRVLADPYGDGTWWPAVPYLMHQVQREGHPCDHLFEGDSGGLEDESMVGIAGAMTEAPVPPNLSSQRG
ncbi:hypothetical protein [Geodermatophilus sp. URMC 64]